MNRKIKVKSKKEKPTIGFVGLAEINISSYKDDFENFGDLLLNTDLIYEVKHDYENLEDCIAENWILLKSVSGRDIIYCIWSAEKSESFKKVYIGEVKAKGSQARIRSHLFKKSGTTGCKLAKVKKAVAEGKRIGITFIEVKPAFFRAAIEEYLIIKHSTSLLWNTAGIDKKKEQI